MADTYAVVQKRRPPAGTGLEASGRSSEEGPVYSQVKPRIRRLQDDAIDVGVRAEDEQQELLGHAPANEGSVWTGAYEDVADEVQTSGLGFNLRIGKPKGPRDPPAEWSQV